MGKSRLILPLSFVFLSGCVITECPEIVIDKTKAANPVPESQALSAAPAVPAAVVEPVEVDHPPAYSKSYSADEIRSLQATLRDIGLNPGPADGIADARTHLALERLQAGCARAMPVLEKFGPVLSANSGRNPSRPETVMLQSELRKAGFNPGSVDGIFGARTKSVAAQLRTHCPMAQEYAASLAARNETAQPAANIGPEARVIKISAPVNPAPQRPGNSNTTKVAGASREEIRILQLRLRDAGFDPGPFDGIMGPRTRIAFEKFQAAERAGKINPAMAKGIGVQY